MRIVRMLTILVLLLCSVMFVEASDDIETQLVEIQVLSEERLIYDPGRSEEFVIVGRISLADEADYSLDDLEVRLVSPVSSGDSVPVDEAGYFSFELDDYYLRSTTYGLNREYVVEVVAESTTVVGRATVLQVVLLNDFSLIPPEVSIGESITISGSLLDADGDTYPQADVQIVHASGHTLSAWKDSILPDGHYRIEKIKPYLAGQYYLKVTVYGHSLYEAYPAFYVLPGQLNIASSLEQLALGREADNLILTVDNPLSKYQKYRWIIVGDGFELPARLISQVRPDLSAKNQNTYTKAVIEQYSYTLDLSGLKPVAGSTLTITAAADWVYSDSQQDIFNYQGSLDIPLTPPKHNLEIWGVPATARANSLVYFEPTIAIWAPGEERFLKHGDVEIHMQGAGINQRFLLGENISFVPRQPGTVTLQFHVWDEDGHYQGIVEKEIEVIGGQADGAAAEEMTIEVRPDCIVTTGDSVRLDISVTGPVPILRVSLNGELLMHAHETRVTISGLKVELETGVNRLTVTAVDEAFSIKSYTIEVTRQDPKSLHFVPGSTKVTADGKRHVVMPPAYLTPDGIPMVPLRAVAEYFGCTVGYNSSENYAWVKCRGRISSFTPGQAVAKIAGESHTLSCPPTVVSDIMYVPASALADAAGLAIRFADDFIELVEGETD